MRFLADRCAGRRLAEWLRGQGHEVFESRELSTDPGEWALLERAAAERRILETIDTDFAELVYVQCGTARGNGPTPGCAGVATHRLDGRGA